ncbi:hypothetical protein A9W97_23720 [Mycobacterium gordonae]|nr:hypothetical protein A9W97_23720 [Mycobacterium gordonae]
MEPILAGRDALVLAPTAGGKTEAAVLEGGMVLSVQSWVVDEGVGGCLQRDTVVIGAGGPLVLTRYGRS